MKKSTSLLIFASILFLLPFLTKAATLSLSPSSGTYSVGDTVTLNVLLNTQGTAIDGVDLRYLNYSASYFQIIDDSAGITGTQITAGALLSSTVINSVDTTNGRISFSQVATAGTTFTNSSAQTLATIHAKVLMAGSSGFTFNFAYGNTSDTNVAAGGADVLSSVTNGSYTLKDTTAPSVPVGLVATAVSSTQINLSWTASTDNVAVTGYKVYRGGSLRTSVTGTSYSNTSLTANTTYSYTVLAYDAAGNVSAQSAPVSATTSAPPDTTAPSAISNLALSDVTTSSVKISWTAPGDDGSTGTASSYDIRYSTANITTTNWASATQVTGEPTPLITGTSQSMTITGLTINTVYYFAIRTSDEVSNISGLSNIVNATTQFSTKFSVNSRVKVTTTANVRATPSISGTLLGTQSVGVFGAVIGGPTFADGYWWWQINYDTSVDGWSAESNLSLPAVVTGVRFTPHLEGISSVSGVNFTFNLYNSYTQALAAQFTAQPNTSNIVILPGTVTNLKEDKYNIFIEAPRYLKFKITNTSLASNVSVGPYTLKAGDLNDDGIINSLDWSSMNSKWFGNDVLADINKDGLVNSIDFSWLNKNWLAVDDI